MAYSSFTTLRQIKTELDILINDLNNPRYVYDEKPGNLRIDFIETFCKHTKSPFNGKRFILELWEKVIIQVAYGFKIAATGLRRFNEVILLVARKNGKTTFIAGNDLAEFFLSRGGVDIVCASNTTEQANILFEEINNMREQSPALSKETRRRRLAVLKGFFGLSYVLRERKALLSVFNPSSRLLMPP